MRGQKVKAFIVPAADVTPVGGAGRPATGHAKQVIAPYKYPREIKFLDGLPKTATGKLKRSELRRR